MLINLYACLKWFERTWRFWVALVFIANMTYLGHLYLNQPKPVEQVLTKSDQELIERLGKLEKELERQDKIIVFYDTYHATQMTNMRKLERNQLSQIDTLKRMCEYIWVITIDKKIAPRQCYPEYNWRREELNGN